MPDRLKEQCHRVRINSAHSKLRDEKKKHDSAESRKKSWSSKHKRIILTNNMFEAWKDAKVTAGYSVCSDSDFAGHLLSLECQRRYEYT